MESNESMYTIRKVLIACQQLEMVCGAIYQEFAEKCRAHGAAHEFFLELAREEEAHAGQFELLFKIMDHTPINSFVDPYQVTNALRSMEGALTQVRTSQSLPLNEMLRISIKSEERLLGLHAEMIAEITDPEWKQYFHDLNGADTMHLDKIRNFQKMHPA